MFRFIENLAADESGVTAISAQVSTVFNDVSTKLKSNL
jgi:hypothetical protein